MRQQIGITTGKLAGKASRMLGKKGGSIPGEVALKFDNQILAKLASQVDYTVLITGTNGKTTVSNLIGSVMREIEPFYVNNLDGNNLIKGITTSFIKKSNLLGKVQATYAILEVDEATLIPALKQIKPNLICITNFFRDQLDRYGEIDTLIEKMSKAIEQVDTKLLINSDDPFSHRFTKLDKEIYTFGLEESAYEFEKSTMNDSKFCSDCGKEMTYKFVHYGQLGAYQCDCGKERVTPNYSVEKIITKEGTSIVLGGETYATSLKGAYNGYNISAAVAICQLLEIPLETIKKGLANFHTNNGRMQTVYVKNVPYTINLVKNPQGMNSTLSTIVQEQSEKQLVFLLNDLDADGKDVSWIWDADFEKLDIHQVKKVIVTGRRAYDMAVRLKHAGIPTAHIEVVQNVSEAVLKSAELPIPTFIVPNYTGLSTILKTVEENKNIFSQRKDEVG